MRHWKASSDRLLVLVTQYSLSDIGDNILLVTWAELENNLQRVFYWLVLAVWNNKERYVKTPAFC